MDVVFEASGSPKAFESLFDMVAPGGSVALIGMPPETVQVDVVWAQSRQARIETLFRYANVFEKAVRLIGLGKIKLELRISATFSFEQSVQGFERAAEYRPRDEKLQIQM